MLAATANIVVVFAAGSQNNRVNVFPNIQAACSSRKRVFWRRFGVCQPASYFTIAGTRDLISCVLVQRHNRPLRLQRETNSDTGPLICRRAQTLPQWVDVDR